MGLETMDSDNINPRLLMSNRKPNDFGSADIMINDRGMDFRLVDLQRISSPVMDFGMAESTLTQPVTIDFSTTQPDMMDFDMMDPGPWETGPVEPGETAAPPGDPSMVVCGLTENFPLESKSREPGTIWDQGTENDLTDIDLPARIAMDGGMTHHNLTDSSDLSLIPNAASAAHNVRTHWSGRTSQLSAQCQLGNAMAEIYTQFHDSKTFPNPTWSRQVSPAGSVATRIITLNDRREYRPKCLEALVRSARITADDWEEYQPFVQQLYIIENVKLKDVMKILETKFGFRATKKMYNTKLKQWGLLKNYKAGEKEQLARVVKAHRDAGKATPQLTLGNRPAKMDRIRRFCKQQKILEEICSTIQSESSSNIEISSSTGLFTGMHRAATTRTITSALQTVKNSSLASVPDLEKSWLDPERPFSSTSKEGRIELVLWQTKIYIKSCRSSTKDCSRFEVAPLQNGSDKEEIGQYVMKWKERLSFGIGAFVQQKYTEGWRLLKEACGMMNQILAQQPEGLLRHLLNAFADNDWAFYADLRSHVLQFFTKISAAKLGCNHPISIALYHLQEQQLLADAVIPAFEVLMDGSGDILDAEDDEGWQTREYYRRTLIDREEFAAAESHTLHSLKQAEEVFGLLNRRTRSLLHEMAYLHYRQGFYELAEAEYQDVVQRGHEDLGDRPPDFECVFAHAGLAWICEERGDFAKSEEYWRKSVEDAIKFWGTEEEYKAYLIGQVEESFRNQGLDPKAWLQQNFGISSI